MSKVNIEGFIEVECPKLNELAMINNKLNNSPHLKIQIFLNKETAANFYRGATKKEDSTRIICDCINETSGECEYKSKCLYNNISINER